jgi:hypothetical protein
MPYGRPDHHAVLMNFEPKRILLGIHPDQKSPGEIRGSLQRLQSHDELLCAERCQRGVLGRHLQRNSSTGRAAHIQRAGVRHILMALTFGIRIGASELDRLTAFHNAERSSIHDGAHSGSMISAPSTKLGMTVLRQWDAHFLARPASARLEEKRHNGSRFAGLGSERPRVALTCFVKNSKRGVHRRSGEMT